jgi:hypothetical protein
LSPVSLRFDIAYAPYSAAYHDSLVVEVSTDCGQTFTRLYAQGDDSLATVPAVTARFVPQAGDWATRTIDLSAYAGQHSVILQFNVLSGYGNDIFLDNINITTGNTGIVSADFSSEMMVFPNPAGEMLNVRIPQGESGRTIELTDVAGRVVRTLLCDTETVRIDLADLASGCYAVVLKEEGKRLASARFVRD